MVDAATSFKKAGYSEEDSAQLALVASLYQNIADEALTAGESADLATNIGKASAALAVGNNTYEESLA